MYSPDSVYNLEQASLLTCRIHGTYNIFSGFIQTPWHRRSTFLVVGIQFGRTIYIVTACFEQGSALRSQQMLLLESSNLEPTCMRTSILSILVWMVAVFLDLRLRTMDCYPRNTFCWTWKMLKVSMLRLRRTIERTTLDLCSFVLTCADPNPSS